MARLIDADQLFGVIAEQEMWNVPDFVYESIKNAPTVDAVPVVRCKDCKYNYYNMIPSGEAEHGCTKYIELPITADFYCSWGERREDETN